MKSERKHPDFLPKMAPRYADGLECLIAIMEGTKTFTDPSTSLSEAKGMFSRVADWSQLDKANIQAAFGGISREDAKLARDFIDDLRRNYAGGVPIQDEVESELGAKVLRWAKAALVKVDEQLSIERKP